jgi:hypothetical protein
VDRWKNGKMGRKLGDRWVAQTETEKERGPEVFEFGVDVHGRDPRNSESPNFL